MDVRTAITIAASTLWAAGCVPAAFEVGSGDPFDEPFGPSTLFGGERTVDDIPPRVVAALPEGIDPSFLMRGGDGCWNVVLERSEPVTGVPLRDAGGEPICT